VVEAPGRRVHYNNFNPLLVGLALERAVGMPVASYLEARLWRPLGMEADGLVLVRFGRDDGYRHWPDLLGDLARRLDEPAPAPTS
jgi:CubicO group peptidase (beta-lactamase class C family)